MDESQLFEELKRLDFEEKEAKVYLALSKRGECTASELSETTQIERTLVYYVIQKLVKRGLASYKLKNNVKYYAPAKPEKILDELDKKTKTFHAILPLLEKIQSQPFEGHAKVDVYAGIEGYKAVENDLFKSAHEILVLGEEGHMQNNYPVLYKQYLKRLENNSLKEKVIVREDLRGKLWNSKNSSFRFISKDLVSPTTTAIYADKVLITLWDNPMFNILITSSKISDSYRSYFNQLWQMARK